MPARRCCLPSISGPDLRPPCGGGGRVARRGGRVDTEVTSWQQPRPPSLAPCSTPTGAQGQGARVGNWDFQGQRRPSERGSVGLHGVGLGQSLH